MIEHLRSLQVTTLELLPVHAHATEPLLASTGRHNYWGYSTLSYFAPHPGYAANPGREVEEFAAMVDALHAAGIEVMLDVVYNHTCEGGPDLPVSLCWRGLAPDSYYLSAGRDLTGTGNTIDPAGLTVVRMVTDSLRYWADDLGVDGFRFDLASVHGRPRGGPFDPESALLLGDRRRPGAGPPQTDRRALGRHRRRATPSAGSAASGPSGTTTSATPCGTSGAARPGCGRWPTGCPDHRTCTAGTAGRGRRSTSSPRTTASPCATWCPTTRKHNEANGENNRDGTDDNRSANHGVEGETDDPEIRALRPRQARNVLATLLLSTGTPMITMGDELWRTQGGNNNAYCQDNGPVVWMDWAATTDPASDAGSLLAFARRTLSARAQAPALHQGEFFDGRRSPDDDTAGPGLVQRLGSADGGRRLVRRRPRPLQMWVNGCDVRGHGPAGQPLSDESWLLVLHAEDGPVEITLPATPFAEAYTPVIDTDSPTGVPVDPRPLSAGVEVTLPGRTVWLLQAHRRSDLD